MRGIIFKLYINISQYYNKNLAEMSIRNRYNFKASDLGGVPAVKYNNHTLTTGR